MEEEAYNRSDFMRAITKFHFQCSIHLISSDLEERGTGELRGLAQNEWFRDTSDSHQDLGWITISSGEYCQTRKGLRYEFSLDTVSTGDCPKGCHILLHQSIFMIPGPAALCVNPLEF